MDIKTARMVGKLDGVDWWQKCTNIGGFDIGKKSNPSHCSVFSIFKDNDDETLVQLHQKFLDGWDYTKQISYIQMVVEYFNISKMYVDNTRGEFEDRSLPRQCVPITLSSSDGPRSKGKMKMAINFAKLVEQNKIKLVDDDRYVSQILCVTNDLSAPNTPMGHGDSFISTMLAVAVYFDFYAPNRRSGFNYLGNLQEVFRDEKAPKSDEWGNKNRVISPFIRDNNVCKICNKRGTLEKLSDGRVHCAVCFAEY